MKDRYFKTRLQAWGAIQDMFPCQWLECDELRSGDVCKLYHLVDMFDNSEDKVSYVIETMGLFTIYDGNDFILYRYGEYEEQEERSEKPMDETPNITRYVTVRFDRYQELLEKEVRFDILKGVAEKTGCTTAAEEALYNMYDMED